MNKLSEKEGLKETPDDLEACKIKHLWDENKNCTTRRNEYEANGYRLPIEGVGICARGSENHIYAGSNDLDEAVGRKNSEVRRGVGQKKRMAMGCTI